MAPVSEPDPAPPRFSVRLNIGKRTFRREITGRANRALITAMALCTLIVGAEVLAGIAWLIVRAV